MLKQTTKTNKKKDIQSRPLKPHRHFRIKTKEQFETSTLRDYISHQKFQILLKSAQISITIKIRSNLCTSASDLRLILPAGLLYDKMAFWEVYFKAT